MSDFGWSLALLGAYVLLVILARWLYIARTNIVWNNAQAVQGASGRLASRVGLVLLGQDGDERVLRLHGTLRCCGLLCQRR